MRNEHSHHSPFSILGSPLGGEEHQLRRTVSRLPPGLLIFIAQGFIGFAVFIVLSLIFLSALLSSLRN